MLLIESDGKELFKAHGIPVAPSFLMESAEAECGLSDGGQWVVKAQVPVGGRGKAGGIVRAANEQEVRAAVQSMLGGRLKGHDIKACLVEQAVSGQEHYLAVVVDPGQGGIRLMYSREGGVDIESVAKEEGKVFQETMALDRSLFDAALGNLAGWIGDESADPIVACARKLGAMFFDLGLLVAEINPLFVDAAGRVLAGDAKVVIDLSAMERTPGLMEILRKHHTWYPDAWRKIQEDFDFIEIDAQGSIGLITTGAGLSMMLLDELIARGARPFNFADVRTGQMRGDPARLMTMFGWLKKASGVRVVLINVFAGITDLEEFAQTLAKALDQVPDWKLPIVARLIGNNEGRAHAILQGRGGNIYIESDLEKAMDLAVELGRAA